MVTKTVVDSRLALLDVGPLAVPRVSSGWARLALGLGWLLALQATPAGGLTDGPPGVEPPWTSLSLEASKLGLKARSAIAVEPQPVSASEELIAVAGRSVVAPGRKALLLTERTSFAGRESQTRIWFDGDSGSTQQREILETGKRERKKVNRFTREGVHSLRLNPTREERGRPPAQWTDSSETFYPFADLEGAEGRQVIEPGALIYLVAAGGLRQPGQHQTLYAFSDKQVLAVDATAEAMTTASVDFQLTEGGKTRRVAESHYPALAITLRAGASDGDDSEMKVLGLEGDVRLLIDPQHRLPLEVSGRVKYVGRVTIRLKDAVID